MLAFVISVTQVFSLKMYIYQEAQRLTWNHSLNHPCLLLSDRLKKKKPPPNKDNIKYETARHLSTEEAITFQLFFGMVKKGIRMCLIETEFF